MADYPGLFVEVSDDTPSPYDPKPKPIDPLAVVKARQAGYSDQEIADHLAQTNPQVQTARQAGYNDAEIVQHLATPPEDHSALKAIAEGALKPLDNLTTAAMHIPGFAAIDRLGQSMGMQSAADATAHNDMARTANTRTNYQTLGNVMGTLPTMALPGGMAVQGAASGALLSDKDSASGIATDAGVGSLASLIGGKALQSVASLAKPVVNKAAVALHGAGVDLSPGQLLQSTGSSFGKAVRGMEDKARSVPFLGSLIGASRDRGTTQLNHAVANEALASVGKTAPADLPAGHDLIDNVEQQLSSEYQRVVPRLAGHFDQQFATDLTAARDATNVLPDTRKSQFEGIVRDVFTNRAPNGHTISGQNLKDAESRLTLLAGQYSRSQDADQKILGDALYKVRQALRDLAVRSDPSGKELQAINVGWAKLRQMEKAANVNGVVLPGALARAANKSGYGTDLARSASLLMPDHVPNSGTADRAAGMKVAEMLLGGGTGGAALTGHAALAGGSTLAGLMAAAPYTRVGQRAVNNLAFAARPKVVQQGGLLLEHLSKGAPVAAPAVLAHNRRP